MANPNTTDNGRYLDDNNRLSSAGAAQSLKYARPKDLPSYPTSGLPPNHQNKQDATTAANLGWHNQKPVEPWRPEPSSSAATAATRGWGTQAPAPWQPEQSMSGARAAVLAAQRNKNLPAQGVTAPPPPAPRPAPSAWANSAANLATSGSRAKRPGTQTPPGTTYTRREDGLNRNASLMAATGAVNSPRRPGTAQPDTTHRLSNIDRHGSLMAATGAMANGPRRRADSTPVAAPTYPDQQNARTNALRAAAHADNNAKLAKASPVGGASPNVMMPRSKFGSNPGSQPAVNDKQHQDALQSSAVAMAQQMYKIMEKKKNDNEATAGAGAALGRNRSLSLSSSEAAPPMRFNNLHGRAEELARLRIESMHDEEAQAREFRDYYAGTPQQTGGSKRLSLGNMFRKVRRGSDDSFEDDETSRKIRADMALFNSKLSKVDDGKRQSDRDHLMEIAQRRVQDNLRQMDQKIYQKTGKVTPAMQQDWEQKAQIYAQQQHEARMEHYGQIDVGGGTYMDQEQIDDVARRSIQPVLDEIDTTTQQRLESDESKRLDAEEAKRQAEIEKQRERESKDLEKKVKEQMKEDAKAKKDDGDQLTRKPSKSRRLSRFLSIGRSRESKDTATPTNTAQMTQPTAVETTQVPETAPALPPVEHQQPIALTEQDAIRDTTYDTTAADQHGMSGGAGMSSNSPTSNRESMRSAKDIALPNDSTTDVATSYREDQARNVPVENTEYNPHSVNAAAKPISSPIVDPVAEAHAEAEAKYVSPMSSTENTTAAAPAAAAAAPVVVVGDSETVTEPVVGPNISNNAPDPVVIEPAAGPSTATTTAPVVEPAAAGPAQNTTKYDAVPAATPPANVLTKKTADKKTKDTTPATAGPTPSDTSPKKEKGVKGWLKKAFHRGSSGDDSAGKKGKKVTKEEKGKRPVIGEPTQKTGGDTVATQPAEATYIGLGAQGVGKTEGSATAAAKSEGVSGVGATSGPLDSHPDVHAVDRSLYDATPPATSAGNKNGAKEYETDKMRASEEVGVSDIDEDLQTRPGQSGQVPSQDASTVSMLSQGSMERRRKQAELEDSAAGGSTGAGAMGMGARRQSLSKAGEPNLAKVASESEMERRAELKEMQQEERDGFVDSDVAKPKFPVERTGSPARETRFKEDV